MITLAILPVLGTVKFWACIGAAVIITEGVSFFNKDKNTSDKK